MELIGFKSFAQDTKIKFPDGLTEIVGPNGSGKSNVIEAIRWALGEQSAKQLRSSKMSDVIFSGSKGHSALNRAKVTLVFDNRDHWIKSDYSELKVARKIYRNGDSYYYLNGKECRLRDVQDLFMNSGIGTGSFSIISQGQVEQIFKSKPEDRRFIIETAAGIYRYRTQKRVAQQKMKATDNNITRVADLVNEYQRQLKRLSGQRDQAQKYLIKRRRYERLDNQRLILRWYDLRQRIVELGHQIDHSHDALNQIKLGIDQYQQKQRYSRRAVDILQQRDDQFQKQLVKVVQQNADFNNQQELILQKLTFQKQLEARIHNRLDRLQHLISQLMKRRGDQRPVIKRLSQRTTRLKSIVKKSAGSKLREKMQLKRQQIGRLRNQYITKLQKSAHVDNQIHNYQRKQRALKVHSHEKEQRLAHFNRLIRQYQSEARQLSRDINRLKHRSKKIKDRIAVQNSLIDRKRSTLRHSVAIYSHKIQQLQSIDAQRSGLNRLMSNHSNLHRGERNLLRVAGPNSGILGPVAKFLQVPGRYVKAIETTLKSQLQQIIVTTPQVARKAIVFLNSKRLGRVTFLPLHDVARRWINRRLIQQSRILPGLVGIASELVTMPQSMDRIKSHLLGNVLVAKDLRSAIQISRNLHHRYRIVTLSGAVVNAGGAITGGRGHYEYHGILSQEYELRQLRNELQAGRNDLVQRRSRVKQQRRRFHRLRQQFLKLQERVGRNKQALLAKMDLQKHVNELIEQQQREIQASKLSLARFSVGQEGLNLNELKHVKQQIQKSLRQNESVVKQLKLEIEKFRSRNSEQRRQYQNQRDELIRGRSKLSDLEYRMKADGQAVVQSQKSSKTLRSKGKKVELLIHQLQHRLKSTHYQINHSIVDKVKARRKQGQSLLTHHRNDLKNFARRINHYQNLLVKKKTYFNRLKFDNHKIIHQLNLIAGQSHKRRLRIQNQSLPSVSLVSVKVKLKQVRHGIKQLGVVNLISIPEFARVHHRYSFLHHQLIDLVQSQHRLSRAMGQMNTTIKTRFKKTFNKINRAFYTTYTEIFKGGHARLKLTDPKHLLTTGINILAQPPGKRYRNMELLSGGERALTAIALLFAVIRIKPVPFCILDEAESALDLVNVSRFAQYISKLKQRTQFIVITHRKETMLYADHLYGITMQQSGISTVISVNLDRIKKER